MKRPSIKKPVQRVYGIPHVRDLAHARSILRAYNLCIRFRGEWECCTRGDSYEIADVYEPKRSLTFVVKHQIKLWRRRNLPVHEW